MGQKSQNKMAKRHLNKGLEKGESPLSNCGLAVSHWQTYHVPQTKSTSRLEKVDLRNIHPIGSKAFKSTAKVSDEIKLL